MGISRVFSQNFTITQFFDLWSKILHKEDQVCFFKVFLQDLKEVGSTFQCIVQTIHVRLNQSQRQHIKESFRPHHLQEWADTLVPAHEMKFSNF